MESARVYSADFSAGLFVGAVGSPLLVRPFLRPLPSGELSQRLLSPLKSQLTLTPEQTAHIKPVVDQTATDLETIRIGTTKQVSDRIADTNSKISAFLMPEQKEEFERMEEERRKRMGSGPPLLPPPY